MYEKSKQAVLPLAEHGKTRRVLNPVNPLEGCWDPEKIADLSKPSNTVVNTQSNRIY
jgi:hypothetical protein